MRPPELLQRVWWTATLPTHPFWTEVPWKMVLFYMAPQMVNCLVTQWAMSFPIRLGGLWLDGPLLHTHYTGRKTCLLFSWDQLRFWLPSTRPSTHGHLNCLLWHCWYGTGRDHNETPWGWWLRSWLTGSSCNFGRLCPHMSRLFAVGWRWIAFLPLMLWIAPLSRKRPSDTIHLLLWPWICPLIPSLLLLSPVSGWGVMASIPVTILSLTPVIIPSFSVGTPAPGPSSLAWLTALLRVTPLVSGSLAPLMGPLGVRTPVPASVTWLMEAYMSLPLETLRLEPRVSAAMLPSRHHLESIQNANLPWCQNWNHGSKCSTPTKTTLYHTLWYQNPGLIKLNIKHNFTTLQNTKKIYNKPCYHRYQAARYPCSIFFPFFCIPPWIKYLRV